MGFQYGNYPQETHAIKNVPQVTDRPVNFSFRHNKFVEINDEQYQDYNEMVVSGNLKPLVTCEDVPFEFDVYMELSDSGQAYINSYIERVNEYIKYLRASQKIQNDIHKIDLRLVEIGIDVNKLNNQIRN